MQKFNLLHHLSESLSHQIATESPLNHSYCIQVLLRVKIYCLALACITSEFLVFWCVESLLDNHMALRGCSTRMDE